MIKSQKETLPVGCFFINKNTNKSTSGQLDVIEWYEEINFVAKRIFWLANIDPEATRGGHYHSNLTQVLFCVAGHLTLILDDGIEKVTLKLDSHTPPLVILGTVWRDMKDFSADAILMVACDRTYKDDMVIRDYERFKKEIKSNEKLQ